MEVCAVYLFHLILYRLSVLPLPKVHQLALIHSLSKLLWSDRKLMVRRQVCCQRPQNGGLGMSDLESHWFAERLAYMGRSLSRDTVWGQNVWDVFLAWSPTPKLKAAVSLRVPHHLSACAERPSVNFLGPFLFWRSWTHITVVHATYPLPRPSLCFFCPIKLRPAPHIEIVRLVFGPSGDRKTVGFPNHRREGKGR